MNEGGYTAVPSIPRNIMHRGRWGVAQSCWYLLIYNAITVPALKRHVIPSNEILVTPWIPHSLSLVRQFRSLSPFFLLSVLHPLLILLPFCPAPASLALVPYNITIANSPVAVALRRSKARPVVKARATLRLL